jgi:hypothetical protein
VMGPLVGLYGVNNEGVMGKAADGITEEPGVDAVDFADKLLTLKKERKMRCNQRRAFKANATQLIPIIISLPIRTKASRRVGGRRAQQMKRVWSCRRRAVAVRLRRCWVDAAGVRRDGLDGLR